MSNVSLFSDPLPAKQPKRRISNAEELLFDLLAEKDGKVTMSNFWAVSYTFQMQMTTYINCISQFIQRADFSDLF